MAAKENTLEKSVEVLEKAITCALCHKHYVEPKVLSCSHYYCKKCIHGLALKTGLDKPFSCPDSECRKDTILPQGSVDNLQPAFFINRMKEAHTKLELAYGTVEQKCENCSLDKATAFCRNCIQFICDECVKSHQRMKLFSGHKVATLTELKEGEVIAAKPSCQYCTTHDQPLSTCIYCFDCSSPICHDCIIKIHSKHTYKVIKDVAPELKEKIKQKIDQLKQIDASLSHAVEQIRRIESEVSKQGESVNGYIKTSFSELYEVIKNYEQELLLESSEKVAKKLEHLSAQRESHSAAQAAIEKQIDSAEQCIKQADGDFMSSQSDISSRVEQLIEEHLKEEKDLKPVEEVDIGVELSSIEELKQICQTKAKNLIVQLPLDPKKCSVTLDKTKVVEVRQLAKFNLVTRLNNGMPTRQKCDIGCHLKSLTSGASCKCEIDSINGSEYCIKYKPTVHGPNQLIVTVNGEEVAGSPFDVFVHVQPGQLGKPVRCITGFNNPRDVAINSSGKIIVTEQRGIVVMDENGNRLNSYKSSEFNISDLFCVAVDSNDNVYITGNSSTNHKIVKLSPTFKQIKEFSTKEKLHFRGLAIRGDEIIACQRDKGIAVYTKDLEYVRRITSQDNSPQQFGGLRDISSDKDGNLYASDYDNSSILVFDKGGEFSRSFGSDENGVNKLKGPRGVWVAGQYVYVANWYSHNVSVFTTEGAHMTSFGHKGSSDGNFKNAWGVCVDKDGFVYVCDQGNNKVHKYFSNYY